MLDACFTAKVNHTQHVMGCNCRKNVETADWTGIIHENGSKIIIEDSRHFSELLQTDKTYNDMMVTRYHRDNDVGYFDTKIRTIEISEGMIIGRTDAIVSLSAPLASSSDFHGTLNAVTSASQISVAEGKLACVHEERELLKEIEDSEDGPVYQQEIELVHIIQMHLICKLRGKETILNAEYVVSKELLSDGCFDIQRRCHFDHCDIGFGIRVPCNPRCQVRACGCGKKPKCGPWHKDNLGLMCSIGVPVCS